MSFLRAHLPHPSKSPERSSPNRVPTERDAPHLEPSKNTLSTTPQVPQWAPEARDARLQNFLHLSLKVPSKWSPPPSMSHIRSPRREKPHLRGQWLIHSFISVGVPNKEPSHKKRGKILSSSTEPHVGGRHTYNGVRPGSPWGSFKTLQSLPHCHTAISTIPSWLG